MSAYGMTVTVLATGLAEAVMKDEAPEEGGFDLSGGLFGRHVSDWIREVAKELDSSGNNLQPNAWVTVFKSCIELLKYVSTRMLGCLTERKELIMDYVIVTGECDGELEVKVMAKIKEGFEPCGGVVVNSKPGAFEFWAQAMIRKPNA